MGLSLDVKVIGLLLFKKFERIHTQDARKVIQKKKLQKRRKNPSKERKQETKHNKAKRTGKVR